MEAALHVLLIANNAPVPLPAQSAEATDSTPLEDSASLDAVTESESVTKAAMMATVPMEMVVPHPVQSNPTSSALVIDPQLAEALA